MATAEKTGYSTVSQSRPITLTHLRGMKTRDEKIVMLTAYDASLAMLGETNGADILLVGDSLGNVIQGHASTVSVTMDHMVYHTRCVTRTAQHAFVVADMPFLSCADVGQAVRNAGRLMQEGHAQMVKIEGGQPMVPIVRALSAQGVPVCSHLGLLPQSVNKLGGFRVQAREEPDAQRLFDDAQALEEAGADMLVLECIPAALARKITKAVSVPVIGIGAGVDCDGQVLVIHDVLGITPSRPPKFSKNFIANGRSPAEAVAAYSAAVRDGSFPSLEQSY